ncbi:MAG: rod shape-determining protein RodA [Ruminococcaceae bacterium]|nr:rod shape-determining protein RodA [Oscillospiraceae bacterium]
MDKNRKIIYSTLDYLLISLAVVCALFGVLAISSAVHSMADSTKFIIIQSAGVLLGLGAMFIIAAFDYEYLGDLSKFIYIACIAMLILVLLIGTGEEIGSKSWIRLGPVGIQPSELAKIGFILTFSRHVSSIKEDINHPLNVLKLLLHMGVLLGLILLQPDFGTAMVFICIFCGILFVAGISWKYMLAAGISLTAAAPVLWFGFFSEYQKKRLLVFLNPEIDPSGSGYHVMQSKIAVGSGQIFGKGLFHGTQTQLEYLPAKHTDFIFSAIGEELGLIGCVLVLALLFALVFRCLFNARLAKDDFGSLICIGVAFMFLAHIFENIGMCIGLMPVTGIPLPFFSYGGTSVVTNFIAVGLVLNVYMRRKMINF